MNIFQSKIGLYSFILLLITLIGVNGSIFSAPPISKTAFTDNFDTFDGSLWHKADGWTNGAMFNCGWLADHVKFSAGFMDIQLDNVRSSGKKYSSGEYRTNNFFHYGTFEVRMKAAKCQGVVSSFFTYTGPSDNQPWDEIDIEFLGKDTTIVQFNYFTNGVGGHENIVNLGFDAAEDYHIYTIEWTPTYIKWYVDGVIKATAKESLPSHPQRIMMNFWPGIGVDNWLGSFTYRGSLKVSYDYVKYTPLKKL